MSLNLHVHVVSNCSPALIIGSAGRIRHDTSHSASRSGCRKQNHNTMSNSKSISKKCKNRKSKSSRHSRSTSSSSMYNNTNKNNKNYSSSMMSSNRKDFVLNSSMELVCS